MKKLNKERLLQRLLEILPGFVSWNIILFPYWGILIIPNVVAYFILGFNIYWFYQSFQLATTAFFSHIKILAYKKFAWSAEITTFKDYKKIVQVIIIPTYKEPLHTLERTLNSIARQTMNTKQIHVVIAFEKREDEAKRDEKMKALKKQFGSTLGGLHFNVHELVAGEIIGKASNEKSAAIWYKKNIIDGGRTGKKLADINYTVVTSCDADHVYHPNHFACLTYKFLDNPNRYSSFWQPAVMFYNNIWEIPAITRVPNTLASIWNLAQLPRRDRLINQQNYSLSFKLLDEVGYWDPDKIPEDWGIFFKAYFAKDGKVEVEPIYLPLMADAAQSEGFWATIKNQYEQFKRWAWGVSDTPWIIKNYFANKRISFWDKTMRVLFVVQSHFLWPVNWFLVTIGLIIPTLLNPRFAKTTLAYTVPKISSVILTIALLFFIVVLFIDNVYKPAPKNKKVLKKLLAPFEFVLLPIAGLIFSAIPGLDAHTRLMLGKYLEYKVTEKV